MKTENKFLYLSEIRRAVQDNQFGKISSSRMMEIINEACWKKHERLMIKHDLKWLDHQKKLIELTSQSLKNYKDNQPN